MLKKLIIPFCLCLFGLIWACNQPSEIQPVDFSINNAQKYIDEYNVGKPGYQKGEYIEGSIYIRSASMDMIIIRINSDELKDTSIVYQLQLEKTLHPDLKIKLANAQVLFFYESLVVNSISTDEMFLFGLHNADEHVNLKDGTIKNYGFGLSRFALTSPSNGVTYRNDPGDPPPAEGCRCTNNVLTVCDSGGEGSSSCSGAYGPNGTQCSVSCSDGKNNVEKWACCSE